MNSLAIRSIPCCEPDRINTCSALHCKPRERKSSATRWRNSHSPSLGPYCNTVCGIASRLICGKLSTAATCRKRDHAGLSTTAESCGSARHADLRAIGKSRIFHRNEAFITTIENSQLNSPMDSLTTAHLSCQSDRRILQHRQYCHHAARKCVLAGNRALPFWLPRLHRHAIPYPRSAWVGDAGITASSISSDATRIFPSIPCSHYST